MAPQQTWGSLGLKFKFESGANIHYLSAVGECVFLAAYFVPRADMGNLLNGGESLLSRIALRSQGKQN